MSRKNIEHTPTSIFNLADELKNAGAEIEAAGKKMQAEGVRKLSLSNQAPIDLAIKTVPLFCQQIEMKILKIQSGTR